MLCLAFLDKSSVEAVAAMMRSIMIAKAGNSGACCIFGVEVGDESGVDVEWVADEEVVGGGLLEGEPAGLDVGLVVGAGVAVTGPRVMFALMFVHGIV